MFLSRGVSRDEVYRAATGLAARGDRVTVAAVRAAVGGGANGDIREMLVDWRRERQGAPGEPTIAPAIQAPSTPGFAPAPAATNVVPLAGAAAEPLPSDVRTLVDRFSQQLHRAWTEALAATAGAGPDDQMAVIRAAAEARVREAMARSTELEDLVEQAQARIVDLEHELRTLETALANAQEELDMVRAGQDAGDGGLARIRDLETDLDAARGEAERLRAELETRTQAARLLSGGPDIDAGDPPAAAPTPAPAATATTEKAAPAAALREALRSAEAMRDMLRDERDRLQAELDARGPATADAPAPTAEPDPALQIALETTKAALAAAEEEKADALAARDAAQNERDALEDLAQRQSKWIEQARTKLETAGLLKAAAAEDEPAETTEAA
ncbi:MAG: DNA-binding protein [Pseudomonadota bacterium]